MKVLSCKEPFHFEYLNLPTPTLEEGEALIQVKRIGICGTDLHAYEGNQPFFEYPRIFGHELSGLVLEDTTGRFTEGDKVTVMPYFHCGECRACKMGKTNCCTLLNVAGVHIDGGMREYFKVPAARLMSIEGMTFDQGCLIEPFSIGAHAVRISGIDHHSKVLVIGAGPIGVGILESCKAKGCEIICVEKNQFRINLVNTNIPSVKTILPGEGTLREIQELTDGDLPDVVFDATGNLHAIHHGFEYMSHGGKFILVGLQRESIALNHPAFHKKEGTLMSSRNATKEDFESVIYLFRSGEILPQNYISEKIKFMSVKDRFPALLDPANNILKAVIEL